MAQNRRAPIFATDADGAPIFRIRTAANVEFKIDAVDIDLIGVGPFFSNDNGTGRFYIRAAGLDNLIMVARVIAGAAKGVVVRYRDRDPRNLRRKNLVMGSGRAKRCDADLMPILDELMAA